MACVQLRGRVENARTEIQPVEVCGMAGAGRATSRQTTVPKR